MATSIHLSNSSLARQCMAASTCELLPRSTFTPGNPFQESNRSPPVRARSLVVTTRSFKFMKQLGLKKPAFLPDFGLEKRKALLEKFYTSFDKETLNSVLADDVKFIQDDEVQPFGKKDWVDLVCERVKPAIPDFSWSPITSGEKDEEGYSIVKIQAVGHHTGEQFTLNGFNRSNVPPVEATGQRFRLEEQMIKVKVEDGKIKELRYWPKQGPVQTELYQALGGRLPASV